MGKQNRDVTINIPDETHGSAIIRIEGNKQGVEEAKAELEDMVNKMKNEKEKDLIIENRFHKQLIGPKGENIQKIYKPFDLIVMHHCLSFFKHVSRALMTSGF